MDFKKIIDLLSKSNVNNEGVYELIAEASKMDLSNEDNQRMLIQKGAKLANKEITPEIEDHIIGILKEKGISGDLLSSFK